MVWKIRDLTNEVFGRLTVKKFAGKRGAAAYWKCHCSCGNTTVTRGSALTSGKAKSCGCYRVEAVNRTNIARRNKNPWMSEMNVYIYHLSVDRPNRRPLAESWSLTVNDYERLVSSACYYCGADPNGLPLLKHLRKSGVRKNGIDRIDNTKGYTTDNCVPCCGSCNRDKGKRTLEEFIETTCRRYKHLVANGLVHSEAI